MEASVGDAAHYDDTLRAVRAWPLQRRLDLVAQLLTQIDAEVLEPRRRRVPTARLADGLLASPDREPPSDDEIARWREEIRVARSS